VSFVADASSEKSVAETFLNIRNTLGKPEVLIYNAAVRRLKKQGISEVASEEFVQFWRINCLGAFFSSREVVPDMVTQGRGTIIFTGATASMRALDGFSSFSVGKFGLRALAQSMARELGPKGIHVAHAVIDGPVDNSAVRQILNKSTEQVVDPSAWINPDAIALQYWNLHMQDKTAWTHELDLRSFVEPLYSPKLVLA